MGAFLKVQSILAQIVSGMTKAASDNKQTASNTVAQRLAHSRNRVPTGVYGGPYGGPYVGGPYSIVFPLRGWTRS